MTLYSNVKHIGIAQNYQELYKQVHNNSSRQNRIIEQQLPMIRKQKKRIDLVKCFQKYGQGQECKSFL
jgi:ABC-type phosphate transport system auxiliary subunit